MSIRLRELLIKHEGLRLMPYEDTKGKLTIGVGRNLDDVGISEIEAMGLLTNDIGRVEREAASHISVFNQLSVVRQDVVLSMIFNLGLAGFMEFKKMNAAMCAGNFNSAAKEMLDSKWAKDVGQVRSSELATMMVNDKYA